jgi:hypothetical protein
VDKLERLTLKVGALEYLVKFLLRLQFDRTGKPVGNAKAFAEWVHERLRLASVPGVDEADLEAVRTELQRIVDSLAAEMKKDRDT